jgi:hypothetical protein
MESDPAGLFAWLVKELEAAETAKERVWLMGKLSLIDSPYPYSIKDSLKFRTHAIGFFRCLS